MVTVAGLAAVAAAAGIAGPATYGAEVSGDEPHYLLTAISLGEDASLDVSDELAAERYRPFHEADLLTQSREGSGPRVSPHDPLLPALLALPVLLGGWATAKAVLALLAGALAALTLWTAVRRFGVPLGVATPVVAVFAAAAPLAVYGHQLYPELPAAVATTAGVAAATGQLRRMGLVVLGGAVVALPWLAVKYVPIAAALCAIGLVRLWRGRRDDRLSRVDRRVVTLAGALLLAGAVYVVAHLAWYGGLTVYASGEFFQAHGGQLSVLGTGPDYLGRASRLIGLLVDRDFGLAAWQPAWLLAVPAAAALARRRPQGWPALAAPFVVAWLMATFAAATMHGWWFPGRQVVVALPLAVIAIAWWAGAGRSATATRRRRMTLACGLGALGVWSCFWLAAQAAGGQLTWIVDFAGTADPWYGLWRLVLPDYMDVTVETWVLQGFWLVALGGAAVWAWRQSGREPRDDPESCCGTVSDAPRADLDAGAGRTT